MKEEGADLCSPPSSLESRAAGNSEGRFSRSGLDFSVTFLHLAVSQSSFQCPFSAVWFFQPFPNHAACGLCLLHSQVSGGQRCCVPCVCAALLQRGCLPAASYRGSLPVVPPLKGEQVPLRNGKPVKLSVSSGAWLLLMRPVIVEIS